VSIGEFTCRNSQEGKSAAGLEMHPHDMLPRFNEKRSRVRPRKDCARKTFVASRPLGEIETEIVLVEVEHQLNCSGRHDPHRLVRRRVIRIPELVDELCERRRWSNEPVLHRT